MQPQSVTQEQPLLLNMHRLLLVASGLVFIVGIPLYVLPAYTHLFFAWTINPPLTAAFLGAAYWSSFFLEYVAAQEPSWTRARIAVPAVLTFTTLTLITTLIHIDKFHFGASFAWYTRVGTWVWLAVYASVPFLMSFMLWRQTKNQGALIATPPPVRTGPQPLPSWLQGAFAGQGGIMVILGIGLFLNPIQVATVWPWQLSALTGQAIGAWCLGIGIAAGHMAWENDWRHIYSGCVGFAVLGGLQLLALIRFATALHPLTGAAVIDWSRPSAWFYLMFMLGLTVTGGYGWYYLRQQRQQSA